MGDHVLRCDCAAVQQRIDIADRQQDVVQGACRVHIGVATPSKKHAPPVRQTWAIVSNVHILQVAIGTHVHLQCLCERCRVFPRGHYLGEHQEIACDDAFDIADRDAVVCADYLAGSVTIIGLFIAAEDNALFAHRTCQVLKTGAIDLEIDVEYQYLGPPRLPDEHSGVL